MKPRHFHMLPIHAIPLLAACTLPVVADQFTLYVEDSVDQQRFPWFDSSIWYEGYPPNDNSNVDMPSQSDNESFPAYTYVEYYGDPLNINSLFVGRDVDFQVYRSTFAVSDTYSGDGFISIQDGTLSLGTNTNYNPQTKTLEAGAYLVWEYSSPNQSIMEWEGADIEINQAYLLFWGTNAVLRDQNHTIRNAMEFFARNEGTLVIEDGYVMNIVGNFTNTGNGSIWMNYNPWMRTPQLNIAGNFNNEGSVVLFGDSVLNVAGGYSGSGSIESYGSQNQISVLGAYIQTGGKIEVSDGNKIVMGDDLTLDNTLIILKGDGTEISVVGDILMTGGTVDTGPSGVDANILKARTGVYQNNATISGEGKLIMDVSVHNSYITPGNTPGKLSIEGNLEITGDSDLEIELGGTVAGESYDVLAQSGGTAGSELGGDLTIKLVDGFECSLVSTDSFTVVTSDMPLAGSFANVDSGDRLATDDGLGTFLVTYGAGSSSPNAVILSDFVANPVTPQTFAEWALANDLPEGKDGPLDDADGDGEVNLIEYAIGQCQSPAQPKAAVTGGNLVVTFSMAKSVTGVTLSSLVSPSMENGSWAPGPAPQPAGTTAARNLFSVTLPYNPANPQFVQLKVEEEAE